MLTKREVYWVPTFWYIPVSGLRVTAETAARSRWQWLPPTSWSYITYNYYCLSANHGSRCHNGCHIQSSRTVKRSLSPPPTVSTLLVARRRPRSRTAIIADAAFRSLFFRGNFDLRRRRRPTIRRRGRGRRDYDKTRARQMFVKYSFRRASEFYCCALRLRLVGL